MNRFTKKSLKKRIAEKINPSLVFFVVVIAVFIVGISIISNKNSANAKEVLETAIKKDIVHCYAIEGYYPPSLDYMIEHYGLTYDSDKYIVDYETIGNNIMPSVNIVEPSGK